MKIGFLFNHDAEHQVAHSLPILCQIMDLYPDVHVEALYFSDRIRDKIISLTSSRQNVSLIKLDIPWYDKLVSSVIGRMTPYERLAVLRRNQTVWASYDAIVAPERTSLFIKKWMGEKSPLLIHTKHGAGDRAQGFSPELAGFDLVLLPGKKHYQALVHDLKILKEGQAKVTGYSKFDTIDFDAKKALRFFDNDKKTVVYNPHLEPRLSSWYDMGEQVLEYFYNQDKYNLIYAPHVMLHKKRVHTALSSGSVRWRKDIPPKYFNCDHIIIDAGSLKSVDMSYTLGGDIYIGDVSSQIYEYIVDPRPAVFLNPYGYDWKKDKNFQHWNFGPVVQDISQLGQALDDAIADKEDYLQKQKEFFQLTFDLQDKPSSQRCAEEVVNFVKSQA